MARNPYANVNRDLDRILDGLERKLETDTKHHREYRQALQDIQRLFSAQRIDHEHATFLAELALAKYQQANERQRFERKHKERARKERVTFPFVFVALLLMCVAIIAYVATM